MVVDLLSIVPCDHALPEQARKQLGARVGDLVQVKFGFGEFGENRQQPRAGGRFKNEVDGGQCRRLYGDEAQRDRRRELLEAF